MNYQRRTLYYFLPLILLLVAFVVRSTDRPLSDFAGYYFGGKAILKGNFMGAYDMEALNFNIASLGHRGVFVSYAPFPPFNSLVFAPFVCLPVSAAKLVFNIISALLFVVAVFRSFRFFDIPDYFLLLIPLLFFTPIVNNVYFGQGYLLLLALLLEGFLAYRKQNLVLSSIFWGVAILFKLFPAVIFFYLLLRKEYKNALYLFLACTFFFLVSLVINGVEVWQYYFGNILPKLNAGELNDPFTISFQSVFMLLKRTFIYDDLLNPYPVYKSQYLFIIFMGLFKAGILAVVISLSKQKKLSSTMSFALWLFVSMLVSPNGSSYSLILLLFPFLALIIDYKDHKFLFGLSAVLLFLACNIKIQWFAHLPLYAEFPRLYLLLFLFLFIVWRHLASVKPLTIFFVALLFILPGIIFIKNDVDSSSYLLQKEKDLFIYDFGVKNAYLTYSFWDGNAKERRTKFEIKTISNENVFIRNNQIYWGNQQLTHSADMKKKAVLVNKNSIIYLSDKNRGVGFYTLRKITLPI
ncbi:MAG: glycosyltransferase family 87 protein [Chitinophagaceae bacterium]|jgi:hypothetical protein